MSQQPPSPETILAAALEIEGVAERLAYVVRASAGHAALRQEVESLLAAHEQAGGFMNPQTLTVPAPVGPVEKPGDRIDRYKLLEQIGEGGFGVVWMAEQEEPVRRRVALKIIKLGMDTKEVVARFEAERQALAMMDHPNIATVFDGGATDIGRPYFVMELVKGVPITEYCDANQLSTRERLELFMQVCHAVQHAHQKGVIHRDLKPSNILVTVMDDRPVPKVIDFGIAKATQARLTEKTIFTRFQQWIGTPAYMSPEQAGLGSLDVDTRSDIYSLGVLLYELLTGRTPFDTQKLLAAGYDAVMRTIREEEPPKPSTRLSTLNKAELSTVAAKRSAEPATLNRLVHGDLDWIVMKALEKDRKRRYATPNDMVRDMELHLRNEPVSAVAPSALYSLQKLLRRHKAGLATATALVLILVLGAAASLWQALRANREASEATHQRNVANKEATRANSLLQETERSRVELESALYRSQVGLACEAWEKADVGEALKLLESCPARLRGWEWNYLRRLCKTELLSFDARTTDSGDQDPQNSDTLDGQLVFSRDGRRLCVANEVWGSAVFDSGSGQRVVSVSTNLDAGRFSEDGSTYFRPPHSGAPAQIVELASGAPRSVPAPLAYNWIPAVRSMNAEWLARLTNSIVEVSSLRNPAGARTFSISPDSRLSPVAMSRDGRWLIAGAFIEMPGAKVPPSRQQGYEVWDTETGKLCFRIHAVTAVFEFDETHLQLAVFDDANGTVELWGLGNSQRRFLKPVSIRPGLMRNPAFSPDGGRLAVISLRQKPQDNTREVLVLNTTDGEEVFSMQADNEAGHGDRLAVAYNSKYGGLGVGYGVTSAAFSPDGRTLALGVMDRTVQLVECEAPFRRQVLQGHRSAVCAVAFSPDGKRLASMDRRGGIRIWDVAGPPRASLNEQSKSLDRLDWCEKFCVSRDGGLVVWLGKHQVAEDECRLNAMNLRTAERKDVSILWTGDDLRCLMAVDEFRIATAQGVWDVSRSNWVAQFSGGEDIAVSRDGRLVAGQAGGFVRVWDAARDTEVGQEYPTEAGSFVGPFPPHDGSAFFAFSPDSRLLAVVTNTNSITVHRLGIDGDSPAEVCRIRGEYPICFGLRGDWLLARRFGGGFLKADTRTGAVQGEFQREVTGDPSNHQRVGWEISPNGRLAVWYDKRAARVISLETGQILFDVGGSLGITWASFSPDGSRLAGPGADDQIRLWDVAAAKAVAKLPVRGWFARFSSDGSRLVVISPEGELSVLDGSPLEAKESSR
jgi:serine/threonine protein kinase/WD40 repeat protein